MILTFPDFDTLSFALLSSSVVAEAAVKPAVGGQDEQGRIWLEPSAALSRAAQAELRRIGVEIGKRRNSGTSVELSCWLEMLPLQKDGTGAEPPPQAAVLFELIDGAALARLAVEMLRLGNDRQTYCV